MNRMPCHNLQVRPRYVETGQEFGWKDEPTCLRLFRVRAQETNGPAS
jgi:hypothetical protein